MNKYVRKALYFIAYVIVFGLFIFLGKYDYNINNDADNVVVAKQFSYLNENNKYKIVNIKDTLKLFDGNGVLLIAYPDSEYADYYASIVNDAALDSTIDKVYLYNVKDDRVMNSKDYQKLLEKVNDYLMVDDLDEEHLYVPLLLIIKDGKIIFSDNETALMYNNTKVKDYWLEERTINKQNIIKEQINIFLGSE